MINRKIFIRILFIIIFICSFNFAKNPVKASSAVVPEIQAIDKEIEIRKKKIDQLEQTINKYKDTMTQKETETVSLKNQLDILSNRVAQHEADIELTQEKIKENQLEIDALNLSISDKTKSIEKQKNLVQEQNNQISKFVKDNKFPLSLRKFFIFKYFYKEIRIYDAMYADLSRSVKALQISTEDLESKKRQVELKKKKYEDLKTDLANSRGQLQEQESAKEQLLKETANSEARYKLLLENQRKQYTSSTTNISVESFQKEVAEIRQKYNLELSQCNKVMASETAKAASQKKIDCANQFKDEQQREQCYNGWVLSLDYPFASNDGIKAYNDCVKSVQTKYGIYGYGF